MRFFQRDKLHFHDFTFSSERGALAPFACDFCEKRIRTDDIIFCPVSEMDEEAVRNFLRANPVFLEDYVMKHVDQDRLERWLIRKTRKLKNKGGKKPANSLGHENNKQSGK